MLNRINIQKPMKLKKSLAFIGGALLAVACDLGGYQSAFYSEGTFETLDPQEFLMYAKDSVMIYEQPFWGSNSLAYANATVNNENRATKAGFIISMQKDGRLAEGYTPKPFASFGKTGGHNSYAFAVYMDTPGAEPKPGITFAEKQYGTATFTGFSYNNTAEIVNLVTYGSATVPPFKQGDWLRLTVSDGTVNKVVDLALYDTELKVVDKWERVEITDMKDFENLYFSVKSNRPDFPLNVCLDLIRAYIEISK